MAREQFVLFIFICYLSSRFADAYDPVDPNGNITINWDFPSIEPNVYQVKVSIHNYQLYRHIERPGWRLSWVWAGHENNRTATSQFEMYIVNFALDEHGDPKMPTTFSIGVPGYTCSNATNVPATSGGEQSKVLAALPDADGAPPVPVIRCTEHMCPIRVHWHVKQSYRGYWRVKTTVTNYDVVSNYTDWNLVVQHPNLRSLTQLFSFNYQPLIQYGTINDTGVFWGIKNYNEMLLRDGNVQTEMILEKDPSDFTFSGGWAFPRRVYFNGHECVMPPPDQYPSLPNAAWDVRVSAVQRWLVAGSCLLSLSMLFLV
ncbi:unnamed protein product [Triticum turgidum subsp. durum]|uniref:COBRA C-terminal domain-containing protein n=1 Tax=Triticum turgidum subsp. durum TaxID=4567 RepID=A0A9R1RQN4_TRITD|nr:unnamed protein product [Triticum turgidum subsp. durum]